MYTLYMAINNTNVKIKEFLPIQIHFNMGKKENWGITHNSLRYWSKLFQKMNKKEYSCSTCKHLLYISWACAHISATYFIFNELWVSNNTGNMLFLEHQWLATNSCLGPQRSMNSVPKHLIQISSLCFKYLSMLHLWNADSYCSMPLSLLMFYLSQINSVILWRLYITEADTS